MYPVVTDTKDMVADLLTKAATAKVCDLITPQLMGHEEWHSVTPDDRNVKPGVCKVCISTDLTFTQDKDSYTWHGLCNACGSITSSDSAYSDRNILSSHRAW